MNVVVVVIVVVVVVSHIQRIGCQPEKITLHGGQSRSWSGKKKKKCETTITTTTTERYCTRYPTGFGTRYGRRLQESQIDSCTRARVEK